MVKINDNVCKASLKDAGNPICIGSPDGGEFSPQSVGSGGRQNPRAQSWERRTWWDSTGSEWSLTPGKLPGGGGGGTWPFEEEERGLGTGHHHWHLCPGPGGDHSGCGPGHAEPGAFAAPSALTSSSVLPAEQGPWSRSQSVSFYSLTGSSWGAGPRSHPPQHSLSPLHYGQSYGGAAASSRRRGRHGDRQSGAAVLGDPGLPPAPR